MKTNDVQIEIQYRKEEKQKNKDMSTSATHEGRQHARGLRLLQAHKDRGGGLAPRKK